MSLNKETYNIPIKPKYPKKYSEILYYSNITYALTNKIVLTYKSEIYYILQHILEYAGPSKKLICIKELTINSKFSPASSKYDISKISVSTN